MDNIWFQGWGDIGKVLVMTTAGYIGMVFLLKISGKRTLSKMNAFDFVVTVALGSVLASVSLSKDISITEGLACIAALVFLQYIITFISYRSKKFKNIITSQPTLLYYKGQLLEDNLKKERVRKEEIYSKLRIHNVENIESCDFIVLETTGELNIVHGLDKSKELECLDDIDKKL